MTIVIREILTGTLSSIGLGISIGFIVGFIIQSISLVR